MERRIARFIAGLRASGVRISIAESQDAWRAVEDLGIVNRDTFRLTLRSTLVKDHHDIEVFEDLFPLYFGQDAPPLLNPDAELTQEEQEKLYDAVQEMGQDIQQLLEWLLSGDGPTEEELEQLGQQAGMQWADNPQEAGRYARRMQQLLNWDQLQDVLDILWEKLAEMGLDPQKIEELKQQVAENQGILQEQMEQYANETIQDQMVDEWRERRQTVNDLMERPFDNLNESELDVLREQVRRLAARLRSRAALRQKRGKKGRLDARSTVRANLRYGGVPFEIKLKTKRRKPKVVVILDVSQSMRSTVEFFLRLLFELQDQIQKTTSFAFYERIENVTDQLSQNEIEKALDEVFYLFPYIPYGTDLGGGLNTLVDKHIGAIDGRTTVIVVGDGRNNYRDPGLKSFSEIAGRARRVVWLNPEYPRQWGTSDSDMHQYAPICNEVFQVRSMKQLTDAIDGMLAS